LTIYAHHSELQVITALSLTSILYKSPRHPLSLFPACCVFVSVPWQRLLTVEILQFHALRPYLDSLPCRTLLSTDNYSAVSSQPHLQCSTELVAPILFFITPWRGPRRQHPVFSVACVTVAAGTCLPIRCLKTGCITPLFILLLHRNGCAPHCCAMCLLNGIVRLMKSKKIRSVILKFGEVALVANALVNTVIILWGL
jgi:hypothetical protein